MTTGIRLLGARARSEDVGVLRRRPGRLSGLRPLLPGGADGPRAMSNRWAVRGIVRKAKRFAIGRSTILGGRASRLTAGGSKVRISTFLRRYAIYRG